MLNQYFIERLPPNLQALRNCVSHYKMRVDKREKDVLKSHGASKAEEFKNLSWKWQGSVTGIYINSLTLKNTKYIQK